MKSLHRPDLYAWSSFDPQRNVDFNSILWVRPGGNVLIDPLPLSDHDKKHLETLGGAATIVVTNSDHVRAADELGPALGAKIVGPIGEKDDLGVPCDRWVASGDEIVTGLVAFALEGSKTPGELVLLLEGTTLITGDLIRAHRAGTLMILPDDKLSSKPLAVASVKKLLEHRRIEAVLVGDGWHVFRDGWTRLSELAQKLS